MPKVLIPTVFQGPTRGAAEAEVDARGGTGMSQLSVTEAEQEIERQFWAAIEQAKLAQARMHGMLACGLLSARVHMRAHVST